MWRTMRMAAYTLAVTLVMSGFALAQRDHDRDDDDGYYHRQGTTAQARQYGYQNGYRDGVQKGRHEGRERDPHDYQTPEWRHATRGYERWMGPVNLYQRGYQEGYSNGFRSGYQSVSGRWVTAIATMAGRMVTGAARTIPTELAMATPRTVSALRTAPPWRAKISNTGSLTTRSRAAVSAIGTTAIAASTAARIVTKPSTPTATVQAMTL